MVRTTDRAVESNVARCVRMEALESRRLLSANGIFFPGPHLPTVAAESREAAKADFNNDGKLDLAVIGGRFSPDGHFFTGGVQVLLNQGADRFAAAGQLQSLVAPSSLAPGTIMVAADFNNDGNPDVAILDQQRVAVFLGNGDGSLTRGGQFLANDYNVSLMTGDFNGDGRIDLASIGSRILNIDRDVINTETQIAILLGAGNGGFGTVFTHIAGKEGITAATIDYNNDGQSDLAVPMDNRVQILTSKGDGTFDFPTSLNTGGAWDLMATDLNRDGHPDLLYSTFANPSFASYALALPSGGFGPIVHLSAGSVNTQGVAAGDFNGDGRADIVSGNSAIDGHGVFLQQADGSFHAAPDHSGLIPTIVGDFNNDGSDDGLWGAGQIFYTSKTPPAVTSGPVYTTRKHTLIITGTRRADSVFVTVVGDSYVITRNRVTYSAPLASVHRIQITTGLGSDSITVDPSVFSSALMSAGAASDVIRGGSGNDTLQGGNGDDFLDGGAGMDFLQGGKGNDVVIGGIGIDALYGNRGTDTFSTSDDPDELLDRGPAEIRL